MERIEGVRVFEFFIALDALAKNGVAQALAVKKEILKRCDEQQERIIKELVSWKCQSSDTIIRELTVYPKKKVVQMIQFLNESILLYDSNSKIYLDGDALELEANRFYKEYVSYQDSFVPFRDSTIKNMILQIEELHGEDNITDNKKLSLFIRKVYEYITSHEGFEKTVRIIDLDFSSIVNLTSKHDDKIGLLLHERTYSYESEDRIVSHAESFSDRSLSTALIVRYLRFAGRKRLYRLIAPLYHSVRFMYDDETFYFRTLLKIIPRIDATFFQDYPCLQELFAALANSSKHTPTFDLLAFSKQLKGEPFIHKPWLGVWYGDRANGI